MGAPISLYGVAVHLDCWCLCLCYLHFASENPEDGKMYLLVPAHLGCPGQSPESCKMVVCVCVWLGHASNLWLWAHSWSSGVGSVDDCPQRLVFQHFAATHDVALIHGSVRRQVTSHHAHVGDTSRPRTHDSGDWCLICGKPPLQQPFYTLTRWTQPCIPPGSLNCVPAFIGWGTGVNVTPAGNTVWSHSCRHAAEAAVSGLQFANDN